MFFFWITRKILRIPPPRIARTEAIEIAGRFCKEVGWTIEKPIVTEKLRTWVVWVEGGMKPSPFVAIEQQTGDVVGSGLTPLWWIVRKDIPRQGPT